MDASLFDSAARALASGTSRRSVLKVIILGAAAVASARVLPVDAALCTPPGPRNFCNADSECCGDALCRGGACVCTGDFKQCGNGCIPKTQTCTVCGSSGPIQRCNGVCQDTTSNNANCGRCGNTCAFRHSCSNGHCCPNGKIWCDGVCKPISQCV